jgi:heme exporter protein C
MLNSYRIAFLFFLATTFFLSLSFYLSTWVAPSDFQQGENYRIIYVHVPAAWMSLLVYIFITITSLLFLITKHPFFNLLSMIGTKIGALFTVITLLTGSFWGKPMWGTFWVWDARLTSVLILLFIYIGILYFNQISSELGSILVCVGLINIPIIKFSVNWWNTLHQPSSITQFGAAIHISMLTPIILMFFTFFLVFLLLLFLETRHFILTSFYLSYKNNVTR